MPGLTLDKIISDHSLAERIFFHLTDKDLRVCNGLNRTWNAAVKQVKPIRTLYIDRKLLYETCKGDIEKLKDYVEAHYQFAVEISIHGWSRNQFIPNQVYDQLINANLKAKRLVLKGRGKWDNCHCPNRESRFGELVDSTLSKDVTNLESVYIASTFQMSSCALLDLLSRSPKLKSLTCNGHFILPDHCEPFLSKRFLCDIESLYMPWASQNDKTTISTIVKRNENITTVHSNSSIVCDLLSTETLTNLRFLSLNLSDRWFARPQSLKRGYKALDNIKYLSTAKNLEALEVRSFTVGEVPETSKKKLEIERLYESYVMTFWDQVAKLPKLTYLAIYGSWELEKTCRELAKRSVNVELLKINLMPDSVIQAIENQDDIPSFSMVDGIRNIKRLPRLRSIYLTCYEKLGTIDERTVSSMKEIVDMFWNIEIKVNFTEEVEDFMNHLMRRANQLGKNYMVNLHIQLKSDEYANILVEKPLRFPMGTNLKDKFTSIAETETKQRFGKPSVENFQIWGLELTGNYRDKQKYEELAKFWRLYSQKFDLDPRFT